MSADDIRAKRLAKLGSRIPNPTASTSASNNNPTVVPESNELPVSSEPEKKKVSLDTTQRQKLPSVQPPTPVPKPVATVPPEQDIANWFTFHLKDIFKVSLVPSKDLVYVESVAHELQESGRLVSGDDLESIFMEVLSELGVPRPFKTTIDYLFHIYNESLRLRNRLSKKEPNLEKKTALVHSITQFSCNYGYICFQVGDMFINNDLQSLTNTFINSSSTMSGFLTDIVYESIEQDGLLDMLNLLFPAISSQLGRINLHDPSYNKYLVIFKTLVGIKQVAAVFSQVVGFKPPNSEEGLDFECKTLLGPLLRLSPLADKVGVSYFGEGFDDNNFTRINSAYDSINVEFKLIVDQLFEIVNKLIRGSPETRNSVMKWFADLVNVSHLRTGSHSDPAKLAGDGIMFNIFVILTRLSGPFLEYPLYSKTDKIDLNYLVNKQCLVDLKEETRVNSTLAESGEYVESFSSQEKPNFISDCFYLTLTYLNYGVGGISVKYDKLKNQIKQLKERIAMIENRQVPQGTNPMMMQFLGQQLPTLNKQLSLLNIKKHTVKALFNSRDLQLEIFDFIVGATVFITKVIDPSHQHPQTKLKIPIFKIDRVSQLDDQDFLRTKCPSPWKYFPEFFLEGMINYCKFTTHFRGCPLVRNDQKLQLFIEFAIILIRCPEILGNPHMKSNIIEILFIGSLPMQDGSPGFLADIFISNVLVRDNILYSLLDLYVMVEKTGASSQFYDKFNSRYYISVILEELWKNDVYKNQLTKYSTSNIEFFVRFIARMLNDTTYLLDETFNELNSIHNFQQEIKRRQGGQPGDEQEFGSTDDLLKNLQSSEKKAESYMGLSNKTMELFKLFTKHVPRGFMLPELVDRLAGMLDYNLEAMLGPKASNLKVEDPTKYHFNPREILQSLCEVYYNLAHEPEFVKAVARDARSFNVNWFYKAERILSTKTMTDSKTISRLVEFAKNAEKQRLEDENDELELGEIPDEFLDPLMFTLMEDPVILPSSRVSIDRSTIKAHLLSDSTDPFNRVPLKLEDVLDDFELKDKIEAFKRSKHNPQTSTPMEIDG
ncbi:Ubiquitin conjugation factor E4 [Yamadazyma tenuis]|uniref:RING-type E3 ubiquitin transferase n=1 Tax=Candida tenuis (strain ATCC 10573 / BCRC 21748 / CBS 615 / JCM 9827 / NBRC 10315 / NRRL Y-1498 / VKM Y-70) TaxID=590646 RepID=G3B8S7_CANTC|nr:uncharacterized protein CANTEDRAFT_136356 [Yamadazyma tenuis ATCC 10573]EGV62419.1 hypothetical protein CANTEDRAFT_136356 [Yamadazyma tenuis ATCC 10573]WEJ93699.1 Ubiquitin conjugation factor E4 [Yamadazyma tenuis]